MNESSSSEGDPGPLQSGNLFELITHKIMDDLTSDDFSGESEIEIVRKMSDTRSRAIPPQLCLSESDSSSSFENTQRDNFDYSLDPLESAVDAANIQKNHTTESDKDYNYDSPYSSDNENLEPCLQNSISDGDGSADRIIDSKFGRLLKNYGKGDIILWDDEFYDLPERVSETTMKAIIDQLRNNYNTTELLTLLRRKK